MKSDLKKTIYLLGPDSTGRFPGRSGFDPVASVPVRARSGFDSGCQHRQHRAHLADRPERVARS